MKKKNRRKDEAFREEADDFLLFQFCFISSILLDWIGFESNKRLAQPKIFAAILQNICNFTSG